MQAVAHSLFSENYRAQPGASVRKSKTGSTSDIQLLMARDFYSELSGRLVAGFEVLGRCEFVAKGFLGVGAEARAQAEQVGAILVLFGLWPAKLRAIQRLADGSIDLEAVAADPPARMSPAGHYVLRAAFLRFNPSLQRTASPPAVL